MPSAPTIPPRMAKAAACLLIALLCTSMNASARHRNRASGGVPGDFSYYLLSLSWSPAFCLSSPNSAECDGSRRFGFIVHGLWPQNEKGWPENCSVHTQVPESVVTGLADIMPARGLIFHEWSAHGTCSGLDPTDFFALLRRAYTGVVIPAEFTQPAQPIEQSPASILSAFQRANPRLPPQSLVVTCSGQDAPRLREVHLCMDRDLAPRACSADAARGACRAPTVIVPPIR
jgi:ribonuclease T2